jgi:hypothetical protein
MYAPDGRIVCPKDFANIDVAEAMRRAAPWRKSAVSGGVVGAVPFIIHVSSSTSSPAGFVYRDWIAILCGLAAVALGGVALWQARGETVRRSAAFAAGIAVLALGAYQVASGFGVFETSANTSSSVSFTETPMPGPPIEKPAAPAPPAAPDPKHPEACAENEACFQLGLDLDKANDTAGATLAYERSCTLGGPGGCLNAAINWKEGEHPDFGKAFADLKHGCELGAAEACTALGYAYDHGQGVEKDYARAKELFEKSCEQDPLGCANLAVLYDLGHGVTKDRARAFELFAKSCDGSKSVDIAFACAAAGADLTDGVGAKADPKRGVTYLEKACELAPRQCLYLARATDKGIGTKKDPAKAKELYAKACDAGNADACPKPAKAAPTHKK